MSGPRPGLDEQEIAMLERLAAAAFRNPWTLYPVSNGDPSGPVDIGPVDEPAVTTATVASMDDAHFIVAVRNLLPAVMRELKRLGEG